MRAIAAKRFEQVPFVRTALIAVLGTVVFYMGFAHAQMPAIPSAPALPGGPIPPAAAGAAASGAGTTAAAGTGTTAAGGTNNIWSFFMKTPAQKAQIKACICGSPIGKFMNSMLMPVGMMTGGLIGPICPGPNVPNPADLAKSPTSAEGAAAKI